jgi:poly(3-hydroxybutyrate) depolymerase
MNNLLTTIFYFLVCVASSGLLNAEVLAAPVLPALAARPGEVTVSGVSSGAFMAVQFQVTHSRLVRGAGILAGGPYYCAEGTVSRALTNCMSPSNRALPPSIAEQIQLLDALAKAGRIDPPEYLRGHRVWMFSGRYDRTVDSTVMDTLAAFYGQFLPVPAIHYVKHPDAGHAMISVADVQPGTCAASEPPFINRCQKVDAAGELLAHLLGPLQSTGTWIAENVLAFDQRPFVAGKAIDASLADEGYVYVPKLCRDGGCRIHVVFHGCMQSAQEIGRRFVDGAGYNTWAENNRLIVLYPQVIARSGPALGSWTWLYNPKGCWDWWGYSGSDYHNRDGVQMRAVRAMIDRLAAPLIK